MLFVTSVVVSVNAFPVAYFTSCAIELIDADISKPKAKILYFFIIRFYFFVIMEYLEVACSIFFLETILHIPHFLPVAGRPCFGFMGTYFESVSVDIAIVII